MATAAEFQQQQAKIDQSKNQTKIELEKRRKQLQEEMNKVDEDMKKFA